MPKSIKYSKHGVPPHLVDWSKVVPPKPKYLQGLPPHLSSSPSQFSKPKRKSKQPKANCKCSCNCSNIPPTGVKTKYLREFNMERQISVFPLSGMKRGTYSLNEYCTKLDKELTHLFSTCKYPDELERQLLNKNTNAMLMLVSLRTIADKLQLSIHIDSFMNIFLYSPIAKNKQRFIKFKPYVTGTDDCLYVDLLELPWHVRELIGVAAAFKRKQWKRKLGFPINL